MGCPVTDFDELVRRAVSTPVVGWDAGRLGERITVAAPWSYDDVVRRHAGHARSLLDVGTGGGKWLAAYRPRPALAVATEAWPPNVAAAAATLRPLGIWVVQFEPADDNEVQEQTSRDGRLPFSAGAFDAVVARNEAYVASDIARVLTPGGVFVTEQVGPGCHDDLHDLLGLPRPPVQRWDLAMAVRQLVEAGFEIVTTGEGVANRTYADVGALVWWLRFIPWAVEGFDVTRFRDRLLALHRRGDPYVVQEPRFYVTARTRGSRPVERTSCW
jgi:SAM-dependent methyltransferase